MCEFHLKSSDWYVPIVDLKKKNFNYQKIEMLGIKCLKERLRK